MNRQFGERVPELQKNTEHISSSHEICPWISSHEVGADATTETPFGEREIVYCDYSASARAIGPIEDYIKEEVLPFYGNTHSSVTVTAEQTTLYVHEARQEIREVTGAGDGDEVIFVGSGTTAAVDLLVHLIDTTNLVVIHSIHEHHSNLLPWRRVAKRVYCVGEDASGTIDYEKFVETLQKAKEENPDSQLLTALTACSNITGCLMDVTAFTQAAKRFNALCVWDYASAAPYVPINVNTPVAIDALFFSGHKLVGGVSTPGVLIVKKQIIKASSPKRTGGGTVFFVNNGNEWYLKDSEYREEGGTPDAVGIIRLALAIKLKRSIAEQQMKERELEISNRALEFLDQVENLYLLGPKKVEDRIPVFSFIIRDSNTSLFFHHNYISALLNDLFGVQSRAGCMCAGPYAQNLLGINEDMSNEYLSALREQDGLDRTHLRRVGEYSQHEILRPGFTRVSIPYFWDDGKINYLLQCIKFVSKHASDFLHLYQPNCESGEWHHHKQRTFKGRRWLGYVSFTGAGLTIDGKKTKKVPAAKRDETLALAEKFRMESLEARSTTIVPDGRVAVEAAFRHLRWFVLPIEIVESKKKAVVTIKSPFEPKKFEKIVAPTKLHHKNELEKIKSENHKEEDLQNVERFAEASSNQQLSEEFCSVTSSDTVSCPVDAADVGKGRMGEFGTDERIEEIKETEQWNQRVVVTKRPLTKEEESKLPWHNPPLEMYKKVTDIIHGLNMIREGDKVLVCLSGGKDSLALLHILHFYQMRCRKNKSTQFELGAITVDPGSSAYNPRPLIEYCRSLNIDYFYEEQDIIGAAKKLNPRSICAFCSRMKRGRLAAAALHHGWNVLAMGQHLDDLAESFFIAAFQNGNLSTMKVQYTTRDAQLRVIRPLVLVREKDLRQFSENNKLPIVAENCPACFNQATERHRMKQMLAQQELIFPDLFHSLRSALRPLFLVDSACTDEMRALAIKNIVEYNKGKAK
ncbi:unnamed protein product [Auanema sp. JU1783]|nr:unnamed protein product [Auanema sp. JU1783]